jgi:DNA repair photolyase
LNDLIERYTSLFVSNNDEFYYFLNSIEKKFSKFLEEYFNKIKKDYYNRYPELVRFAS